jgi:CheY-like chemotaxis protein
MTKEQVLIMDDEPHLLDWLVEYFDKKGYASRFAINVSEAVDLLNQERFRMLVLDLNVPAPGEYSQILNNKGTLFQKYRGLYVAEYARTKGYRDRQVVVYSVHDVDEVRLHAERMSVTYVTKGRPRAFKVEIDDVLSYDPSTGGA